MGRLLIPLVLLLALPLSAQTPARPGGVIVAPAVIGCASPLPFLESAASRDVVVRARVATVPDRLAPAWVYGMEVLDVLKGQVGASMLDVWVHNRSLPVRLGEEWLLALPATGTLFVPHCGVFAVRLDDSHAVGRIESLAAVQRVPLDTVRTIIAMP
jgi:hypothetical protein